MTDNFVKENIKAINENIAEAATKAGRSLDDITLMAVTKTVPPELINQAFDCGVSLFGENRVQEFLSKQEDYSFTQQQIHFIGHLQTNKIKYIIDKVDMIESVDSEKLMSAIDKESKKHQKITEMLIEVNIGREISKFGVLPENAHELVEKSHHYDNVRVRGLMCIPPKEKKDYFFSKINELFVDIRDKKRDNGIINILSMGMSGDYPEAILHGSNIIRLGTKIFGQRN